MIVPGWWVEVQHGEWTDVVEAHAWSGVRMVLERLAAEALDWSTVDVYDDRGHAVLCRYRGGCEGSTTAPRGGPVLMRVPQAEGRYVAVFDSDDDYHFERIDEPPARCLVEWVCHRDLAARGVHVAPYDLDPNPVSIAMRIRKRVWNEEQARKHPKSAPRPGTGAARPK